MHGCDLSQQEAIQIIRTLSSPIKINRVGILLNVSNKYVKYFDGRK